jgi:membrane protein YqaA with SNARE-associated domain
MLRKLYDWVMSLAARPQAAAALGLIAFCEGIFFPIPPDVLLMPVVLARRERALRYAAITLVCSVAGGSVGYAIGSLLQPLAHWILSLTGNDLDAFQAKYAQYIPILIAVPIPYKLTAIAAGVTKLNFGVFLAVSILVRGLRFGGEALLLKVYGEPIRAFVEKRLALVASAAALAIVGLFMALKFALH